MLKKLDNYLNSISKKEKVYLYLMTVLVILFSVFYFIKPNTEKIKNQEIELKNSYISDINQKRNFLKFNDEFELQIFEKKIDGIENKISEYKKSSSYVSYSLENLDNIIHNLQTWGKFLSDISIQAEELNITILELTNRLISQKEQFGKVLEVELKYQSNFIDTVIFINFLEQNGLIVDINYLSIIENQELNLIQSDIKVTVWGISK